MNVDLGLGEDKNWSNGSPTLKRATGVLKTPRFEPVQRQKFSARQDPVGFAAGASVGRTATGIDSATTPP